MSVEFESRFIVTSFASDGLNIVAPSAAKLLAAVVSVPLMVTELSIVIAPPDTPMFMLVAAPPKLIVVVVPSKRFTVLAVLVTFPPFTARSPVVTKLPLFEIVNTSDPFSCSNKARKFV